MGGQYSSHQLTSGKMSAEQLTRAIELDRKQQVWNEHSMQQFYGYNRNIIDANAVLKQAVVQHVLDIRKRSGVIGHTVLVTGEFIPLDLLTVKWIESA